MVGIFFTRTGIFAVLGFFINGEVSDEMGLNQHGEIFPKKPNSNDKRWFYRKHCSIL